MRPLLVTLAVAALCSPAYGQSPGFGLRVGVTDDPDSVFLGGHANFDDIGDVAHLRLQPSLDVGYGEQDTPLGDFDYFTLRLNGNVAYLIPIGGSGEMFFYPVGGLSVYYINYDGGDDTEIGINLGVGFEIQRFAIDLWLGFDDDDLPDFTLAGSYTF